MKLISLWAIPNGPHSYNRLMVHGSHSIPSLRAQGLEKSIPPGAAVLRIHLILSQAVSFPHPLPVHHWLLYFALRYLGDHDFGSCP